MSAVFSVPINCPSLPVDSEPWTPSVPCNSIKKSSSCPSLANDGGSFGENAFGGVTVMGTIIVLLEVWFTLNSWVATFAIFVLLSTKG